MSHIGKNKLNKNFNSWAILSLLSNTQKNERASIAWKIVAGEKITVDVSFHIIRKAKNEIVVRAQGAQAKKVLGDLSVGAQNLNFYLPIDSALFQTEVKQILTNGDIIIKVPEMMAQVERRKNMRLFLEEGLDLPLEFYKKSHGQRTISQKFSKKCFDISAGGLSFVVSKTEVNFFKENDLLAPVEFTVDGKLFKIKSKVTRVLEIEPNEQNQLIYKAHKVCLRFEKLSPDQLTTLNKFVFQHIELDEVV